MKEEFTETGIEAWLRAMPLGQDLWKELDEDKSMEALNRQPIFEFRHMRNARPDTFVAPDWVGSLP